MNRIESLFIKGHRGTVRSNIMGYMHGSSACHVQEGNSGVSVQRAAQNDTGCEFNRDK